MTFQMMNRFLMNEAQADGGEGGGTTSAVEPSSLLAGANAGNDGGNNPTPAEQQNEPQNIPDFIPEKYRVTKEDGTLDIEASARKMSEGYTNLEKRIGTGDLPPKTAEEYQVELPEDAIFKFDEFKAEPENQEFLKKAHELGMTDKQMQFVLGEYAKRLPEIIQAGEVATIEATKEQLSQVWKSDMEFNTNLKAAFTAFNRYAAPEDKAQIDQIGNNPIVIKMLANIGKGLQEDNSSSQAQGIKQEDVRSLMASEAYQNAKHPDHPKVMRQVQQYYQSTYGNQIVS